MAKKKKKAPEEDDIPSGEVDEDGDEIIDLWEEEDDLYDDKGVDLDAIDDDMLSDETEEEEFGHEISEVEKMLRDMKCKPCKGSSTKKRCKVRDDFGCPPDKADK